MEYREFFGAATQLREPFPYQERIAAAGFPRLLEVPTGAGKTAAVVLGWLWRRREHPDIAVRAATPRRLVYCLPMRVLVEQTRDSARQWLKALGLGDDVLVHTLMGGEVALDWDRDPERDAILVGTQDQLLSRALNRGYAMSRYRWPVQFALLNSDCLWAIDEVQLMGPGLATSVQLDSFRRSLGCAGPSASVWMSATLQRSVLETVDAPTWPEAMVLGPEDRQDPTLATRLRARKPLARASLDVAAKTYAEDLAALVRAVHKPGTLTLVILNTVQRAQDAGRALGLGSTARPGDSPEVVLLHSSFRPPDRAAVLERVLAPVSPSGPGRVVVATQAVEAGIDLDARAMVSELAPWASMVQRFGRCNRTGAWSDASVHWVDLTDRQAPPYDTGALDIARAHLDTLTDVGISSLEGIADETPPPTHPVLRRPDILDLFDSTQDLSGHDVDVSAYIRERDDHDLSVFWRILGPATHVEEDRRPAPAELCSVGIGRFREFLKRAGAPRAFSWDALGARWEPVPPARLRPGMALMLPAEAGGYTPDFGWWESARADVPELQPVDAAGEPETYDGNPLTRSSQQIALPAHTDAVVRSVQQLRSRLSSLDGVAARDWDILEQAARWHDAGKAHPEFQRRLGRAVGTAGPPLAKGPYDSSAGEREHFRHELASALAALAHGSPFLAAYLAACHHGKVRLSLRSMPNETLPPDPAAHFARGVWDGDVLAETDLGAGVTMPRTALSLRCMEMGLSDDGEPSWLDRALGLLREYGPFRLAYLEAVLRVADWRASAAERGGTGD